MRSESKRSDQIHTEREDIKMFLGLHSTSASELLNTTVDILRNCAMRFKVIDIAKEGHIYSAALISSKNTNPTVITNAEDVMLSPDGELLVDDYLITADGTLLKTDKDGNVKVVESPVVLDPDLQAAVNAIQRIMQFTTKK